jgi:hypothetical protein
LICNRVDRRRYHMADVREEAKAAWGGIGGSGRHAEALAAELLQDERFRDLVSGKAAGQLAWGGIGGSGKHAEEMEPQTRR